MSTQEVTKLQSLQKGTCPGLEDNVIDHLEQQSPSHGSSITTTHGQGSCSSKRKTKPQIKQEPDQHTHVIHLEEIHIKEELINYKDPSPGFEIHHEQDPLKIPIVKQEDSNPIFKCLEKSCKHQFFKNERSLKAHKRNVHRVAKGQTWTCQLCDTEVKDLKSHMLQFHREQMGYNFRCQEIGCWLAFSSKVLLDSHMEGHQKGFRIIGEPNKRRCPKCKKIFSSSKIESHIANHLKSQKKSMDFQCKFCGKIFAGPGNLKRHENTHTKTNQFPCSLCDKVFARMVYLKIHEEFHKQSSSKSALPESNSALSYPCEFCPKICPSRNSYYCHTYKYHREEKGRDFKCTEPGCFKICATQAALNAHQKSHQNVPKTRKMKWSKCPICEKFVGKFSLKGHMEIHKERVKAFKCQIEGCGGAFFDLNTLKSHTFKIHESPQLGIEYECKFCNRIFVRRDLFQRHRARFCNDSKRVLSTNDRFECPKCPRVFAYAHSCELHLKTSHGKPVEVILSDVIPPQSLNPPEKSKITKKKGVLQCKFCEKTFQKFCKLKRHENIHTKAKQYPCSICGKIFLRPEILTTHEKSIHLKYSSESDLKETGDVKLVDLPNIILPDDFTPSDQKDEMEPEINPTPTNSAWMLVTNIPQGESDIGIKFEVGS